MKITGIFIQIGLTPCNYDNCVFHYLTEDDILIVTVFVDDFLAFANKIELIDKLVEKLKNYTKLKDLGDVKRCFNINISRDRDKGLLFMDQTDYIADILKEYKMKDCNPCHIPMDPNQTLSPDLSPKSQMELEYLSKIPFQNVIGSLMFLLQMTRPDLGHVVSTMSRINTSYNEHHWKTLKKTLRYLKATINYKLCYQKSGNQHIIGHCDAAWACNLLDGKSVSGFVFLFQGAAICWHSKKQQTVATSSTVAEYQSLATATMEALWLRGLAMELYIENRTPIQMFCDNKGAVDLAKNANFTRQTRHVCIKHNFIKESVDFKRINVPNSESY